MWHPANPSSQKWPCCDSECARLRGWVSVQPGKDAGVGAGEARWRDAWGILTGASSSEFSPLVYYRSGCMQAEGCITRPSLGVPHTHTAPGARHPAWQMWGHTPCMLPCANAWHQWPPFPSTPLPPPLSTLSTTKQDNSHNWSSSVTTAQMA